MKPKLQNRGEWLTRCWHCHRFVPRRQRMRKNSWLFRIGFRPLCDSCAAELRS